ncbi:MAG: putative toxin-antitoxin system toxin component, PIN family [Proteobacteria bacterium]|nr:putative toxin-antitoxin system toxin component, PIN family [Pseudomonadota bacterium]MBU4258002.1 putative toxin-antitoxin system toxin component, PIN family [Pseudomonadota bacterium]MCG2708375.1 putative toxin-antitoxin system toxin component, PIN family [Candidatus Omnitrophota bacterium]MCG2821650.1 putative toxin-antitoxin system toxin component, PIN family [Candidatus Atribacteria bacterium]
MLKTVIDTNLFVSSIINKSGIPAKLLQAWQDHDFLLIISDQMLEEMRRVLQYPHIKNKYNLKDDDIAKVIDTIERFAVVLHDVEGVDVISEDPDDNKVLACAIAAEADFIISGDKHLLKLGKFEDIPIMTAKDFLKKMESE